MRSVESRAATRGDHENFHIMTLLSVPCTRSLMKRVARDNRVFAVSTPSTLAALRVPSAVCPAHHSSAWRESNPFVSHQGASPVCGGILPRAPKHVVRNPLRAALHPLHPLQTLQTLQNPRGISRDAIRRHQQLVRARRRHRLRVALPAPGALVSSQSPARETERAETPRTESGTEAEMIGERGIEPAEPSVREEGVHPGAPVHRGVDGRGAAAAPRRVVSTPRHVSPRELGETRAFALRLRPRGREVLFERLVP